MYGNLNPPVSFTRTITTLPVSILVTFSQVPMGNILQAVVVGLYISNTSPLAVRRPWNGWPYQVAKPVTFVPKSLDGAEGVGAGGTGMAVGTAVGGTEVAVGTAVGGTGLAVGTTVG